MQKTQNADIQRVMNLVDFYRTKAKESDAAKDAQMEYEDWYEFGVDQTQAPNDAQWKWVKTLCFNEQLLGHFYSVVAGDKAEKDILQQLLPEAYDTSIFTQEEEGFLKEHFKELVNYIIQTPDNVWSTKYSENSDGRREFLIPEEVLEVIKSRVNVPDNAVIYNPFAWFGQLATLFKSNTVLWGDDCDLYGHVLKLTDSIHSRDTVFTQRTLAWMKSWAWAQVAMYANNVNARIMKDDSFGYDVLISYLILSGTYYDQDHEMVKKVHKAYNHLKEGGKMILICPRNLLYSKSSAESIFRRQLVEDGSIVEIIQMPPVMGSCFMSRGFCIIIAEKGRNKGLATFIDARTAFKENTNHLEKDYHLGVRESFDFEAWNTMLQNEVAGLEAGLKKVIQLDSAKLNPKILLPEIYALERPSKKEHPVPLSSLCTLESTLVGNIKFDLPEDTPWIDESNLTLLFSGPLDISTIQKANCPNNPKDWRWGNKRLSKFMNSGITPREMRISEYRDSWFLDGSKDVVLYISGQGSCVALVRATGKPYAISRDIMLFCPLNGHEADSLAAILRLPIVYKQIVAYQQYGISSYLDDIFVPTDKSIIDDELFRMKNEESAITKLNKKSESMKAEYINEVRMRKHDMRPHMKQLNSAKNLMQYYVENMDSIPGVQVLLNNQIRRFSSALEYLSDLVEHFSDEEQFGEPERFDLHEFLSHLEERHKTEGYAIKYECDMVSIIDYNLQKKDELDDFLLDEQMDEYARTQQEIDDYLLEQEEEDARIQQEIEDSLWENEAYVFGETQTSDGESYMGDETSNVHDEACVSEETQASDYESYVSEETLPHDDNSYAAGDTQDDDEPCVVGDDQVDDDEPCVVGDDQVVDEEPYMVGESQVIDDGAYVFEETQANDDEPCMVDDTRAVDDEAYVMDGVWGKYLTSIPLSYMAPNDIQRLVDNILNNAWKHGFENSERNDHEVNVKLSIDTKRNMFQIDFRNNGNPLPDGMDKMRYGLLGEKAGKAGGTGIGGNYVKKFVEHYGGDYDIFMENGWVVIRIYLPIK